MSAPKSGDSPALSHWRVDPPRNPQFRAEVWARIDAAARPSTWAKFARAHPGLVTSALAAAILLGAWRGRTEAREQTAADRYAIAGDYVHALDARWMRQR